MHDSKKHISKALTSVGQGLGNLFEMEVQALLGECGYEDFYSNDSFDLESIEESKMLKRVNSIVLISKNKKASLSLLEADALVRSSSLKCFNEFRNYFASEYILFPPLSNDHNLIFEVKLSLNEVIEFINKNQEKPFGVGQIFFNKGENQINNLTKLIVVNGGYIYLLIFLFILIYIKKVSFLVNL